MGADQAVWLLVEVWGFEPGVVGVYGSRELAEAARDALDASPLNYRIEEREVQWAAPSATR